MARRSAGHDRDTAGGSGTAKGSWVRWTSAMREAFLDHLAATCNVKEAAETIGVNPVSVYALRRRESDFADQWEEALALGYQMLETRVVGHVLAGGGPEGTVPAGSDDAPGTISFETAMKLLVAHRNATGKPRKGRAPSYATRDETDKRLLERLDLIEARRARAAARAAAAASAQMGGDVARTETE